MTGLFLRLHEGSARGHFDSFEDELLSRAATGWAVENACKTLLPSCMRAIRKIDARRRPRSALSQRRLWSDTPSIRFIDSLVIVEDDIILPLLNDLESRVKAEPKRYLRLARSLTSEVEEQMVRGWSIPRAQGVIYIYIYI